MKAISYSAATALLVTLACSLPGQANRPQEIVKGDLAGEMDRYLAGLDAFSATVLVAKDGDIILQKAYGTADATTKQPMKVDSLVDIASTTKQFTAAAALILQQKGKLNLDDGLEKFFPNVPKDKARVSLRMLLNHTSGIMNAPDMYTAQGEDKIDFSKKDSAIAYYLDLPMVSDPGTVWAYSNIGYNLLAAVIEKVTGTTWQEVLRKEIFEPVGMKSTWCLGDKAIPEDRIAGGSFGTGPKFPYGKESHWAGYTGAGGVYTTAADLYLWDRVLRGEKILTAPSKRMLYQEFLGGYALGWFVTKKADKRRAHHAGSVPGFLSQFIRGLDDDIVVVVLSNMTSPQRIYEVPDALYAVARDGKSALPMLAPNKQPQGSGQGGIMSMPSRGNGTPPPLPTAVERKLAQEMAGRYAMVDSATREALGELKVSVDGNLLRLEEDDWKLTKPLLSLKGYMTGGGATVDQMLGHALTELEKGDKTPFLKLAGSNLAASTVETWADRIRSSEKKGKLIGHEFRGYYFVTQGTSALIQQFVRLKYERGTEDVSVSWFNAQLFAWSYDSAATGSAVLTHSRDLKFFMPTQKAVRGTWAEFKNGSLRISSTEGVYMVGKKVGS